ncbi:uncharacterized protein LOC106649510 [Trichogramma pretiosum]|uniref:uncharacterized protein LOC106649510 n=1 Tax=Trichogramma pretiosum TaxID=7493 RepID=UPI0006C9A799|nr:uncharacterized protein LOC106649510 [Trichogramma pretiosum]
MKPSVVAALLFTFLSLHSADRTLGALGKSRIDREPLPAKLYDPDSFDNLSDDAWVGRSLFYAYRDVDKNFEEAAAGRRFLMLVPDLFNQTDHWSCPLLKDYQKLPSETNQKKLDFTLLSPYSKNLVVYGSIEAAADLDNKRIRLARVQLADCGARVTEMTLDARDDAISLLNVLPYVDGTYDFVYVVGPANSRTVRTTYDPQGRRVQRTDSWFPVAPDTEELSVVPLRRGTRDSGHLLIEKTDKSLCVTLIDKYGKATLLKNHKYIPKLPPKEAMDVRYLRRSHGYQFDYSLEHDTVGLCFQGGRSVTCSQFDFAGNMKLEKSMKLDRDLLELALHNEPANRGGFLLMLTLEEDEGLRNVDKRRFVDGAERTFAPIAREKDRRIFRIDERGRILGSMDIYKFGCELEPKIMKPRFFDLGGGNYCLAMICWDSTTLRHAAMGVAKNCFSHDDFTQKA